MNNNDLESSVVNGAQKRRTGAILIAAGIGFFIVLIFLPRPERPAQVDRRTLRVQSDLHNLSGIIAKYQEKMMDLGKDDSLLPFRFGTIDEVWPDAADVMRREAWPSDPYQEQGEYFAASAPGAFLLTSVGPDGELNVSALQIKQAMEDGSFGVKTGDAWSYSPTNGQRSSGDIFRVNF